MTRLDATSKIYEEAFSLIKKDTKRSDLKENYLATLIFDTYNTTLDKDGKTDDKLDKNEWRALQSYITQSRATAKKAKKFSSKSSVKEKIDYFENEIAESNQKLEQIYDKAEMILQKRSFEQFLKTEAELEQQYQEYLSNDIYTDSNDKTKTTKSILRTIENEELAKKAIEEGAIPIYISSFERGYKISGENWTGIQQTVYITIPKEIPEEKRQEFLNKLAAALEDANTIAKLKKEVDKEFQHIQEAKANMNSILSTCDINQTGEKALQAWNNNPLSIRVRQKEEELKNLLTKVQQSPEIEQRISSVNLELRQLYDQLEYFSGIYNMNNNSYSEKDGYSITYEESVRTQNNGYSEEKSQLTNNTHSIRSSWQKVGWSPWTLKLGLNFNKEEEYLHKKHSSATEQNSTEIQHRYLINPSLDFSYKNFGTGLNTTLSVEPNMFTKRNSGYINYKNTRLSADWCSRSHDTQNMNEQGEQTSVKNNDNDITLSLSQQIKNYNMSGSIEWSDTEKARIYSLNTSANFNKFWENGCNISVSPSINGSYVERYSDSEQSDVFRANAGASVTFGYQKNNKSVQMTVSDNYSGTFSKNNESMTNNAANVNINANFGKFGLEAGYANYYNKFSKTNQGDFAISYTIIPGLDTRAGYTISNEKSDFSNCTTNTFTMSIRASLDQLANRKKARKK